MALAISIIAALLVAVWLFHWAIRYSLRAPRIVEQGTPAQRGLAYRQVAIPTARDKNLFGWFIPAPDGGSAPVVAVLHGWGSNAEQMLPVAVPLNQAGYAVLLFDARSHGRSDGDSFASLPHFAEDMDHALAWLRLQLEVDATKLSVLGHSVGAGAVLLAASRRDDLAAVVSIAAFAHPANMMRRFMAAHHVPYVPLGWYVLRYVQQVIGYRFDAIAPSRSITAITCPVLLVHGSDDSTVPVADAEQLYALRSSNAVELLILRGEHDATDELERHAHRVVDFLDQAMRSGV